MKLFITYFTLIGLITWSSCNRGKQSQDFSWKWSKDLLNKKRVYDSVVLGLRDVYFYDTIGNRITREKCDSLLQTGEFELRPIAMIDLQLNRMTKEAQALEEKIRPFESDIFKPGSEFPDFQVKDMDGRAVSSAILKGKFLVINFWFIACTPCRAEMKGLNKIVDDYSDKGINFIGMTPDKYDEVKKATKKFDFKYRIIPDQEKFITTLPFKSYPTHVVVDKTGKVVLSFTSSGPNAIYWLRKTIDSCLASQSRYPSR